MSIDTEHRIGIWKRDIRSELQHLEELRNIVRNATEDWESEELHSAARSCALSGLNAAIVVFNDMLDTMQLCVPW